MNINYCSKSVVIRLLSLLVLLVGVAPNMAKAQPPAPTIEVFKWITGTWKHAEKRTYEFWAFSADKERLEGIAYKVTDLGETVITERLEIICREESCYYIADVPNNPEPTRFKIVDCDRSSFRSENPEHNFPKFVAYKRISEEKMEARIGNREKTISFPFEKIMQ